MSTTARVETRGDGVVVLHLAVPGGAHVELPMGRREAHELGSLLLDAGDEPAPLLPVASPGDVQVFAAGGRVQTRVVAGCDGCGRRVLDPSRRCDDCQREFEQWRDDGAGAPVAVVGPGPAALPPGPVLPVETRVFELDNTSGRFTPDLPIRELYPTRHTEQRIAEGAELDAERAGRACQHDTIRVEDHDGILRCAGCQEPTPRGAR